jgi:hypothetical protein
MSAASKLLAAAVQSTCAVDQAIPYRPARLSPSSAYVEPADPWKELSDSFCGYRVGLVVVLIAGSTDPIESIEWLDVQSTALMAADPVDVGDDVIDAIAVGAPILLVDEGGGNFYGCRVDYSRFTTGE